MKEVDERAEVELAYHHIVNELRELGTPPRVVLSACMSVMLSTAALLNVSRDELLDCIAVAHKLREEFDALPEFDSSHIMDEDLNVH
jgi:hypothetical protein